MFRIAIGLVCLASACGGNQESRAEKGQDAGGDNLAARPVPRGGAAAGSLGGVTTGGLAALMDVGARLQRAATAYRAGQDPGAQLAPIAFEARDAVRLELEHAGAAHVTHLGFELELLFFAEGRGRYYVRTLIHAGSEGVSFLRIEGKPQPDGRLGVHGEPFEAWTGAGEPFAAAGRDLLARLRGPECANLPLVEPERLRALIPSEPALAVLGRDLTDSRAHLAATCAGMAEAAGSEVQLRIDDHLFLVRAGDGSPLGLVRGNLKHREDGTVTLDLGRYRPFK